MYKHNLFVQAQMHVISYLRIILAKLNKKRTVLFHSIILIIVLLCLILFRNYISKSNEINYRNYLFSKLNYSSLYKKLNPVIQGWGENGKPIELTTDEERKASKKSFHKAAFSVYISDRIR